MVASNFGCFKVTISSLIVCLIFNTYAILTPQWGHGLPRKEKKGSEAIKVKVLGVF